MNVVTVDDRVNATHVAKIKNCSVFSFRNSVMNGLLSKNIERTLSSVDNERLKSLETDSIELVRKTRPRTEFIDCDYISSFGRHCQDI